MRLRIPFQDLPSSHSSYNYNNPYTPQLQTPHYHAQHPNVVAAGVLKVETGPDLFIPSLNPAPESAPESQARILFLHLPRS